MINIVRIGMRYVLILASVIKYDFKSYSSALPN